MLSAEHRGKIETEILERWDTVRDHLADARAEIDLIKTLKACLDLDDSLRLRLAAQNGERVEGTCAGLRLIHGAERQSK